MNYWQLIVKTTKNTTSFIEEIAMSLGALSIDFSDTFDAPILEPLFGTMEFLCQDAVFDTKGTETYSWIT